MLDFACSKLAMDLLDAIAILECAEQDIFQGSQQTPDVWEALRTVSAAGALDWHVRDFWRTAGEHYATASLNQSSRQTMNASLNGFCRQLRVVRTWRRHPDMPLRVARYG